MKVFEIVNKENEVYIVKNKYKFCKDKGLTRRLLDYTFTGEREHHKGYILKRKLMFIPSLSGDKVLYDSDELGYLIYPTEFNDNFEISEELQNELIKTQKKVQSLTDKLRVLRKINRQKNREENIQDDFINNVVDILSDKVKDEPIIDIDTTKELEENSKGMIVQLSDIHFGKVINLPVNKFNFDIAKKRFKKYAEKINYYIDKHNVDKITLAFTGDLINLDSHMDSLLSNEDNRANSFVEALDTLVEFINSIRSNVNSVSVVGVTGNESRIRTSEYHSNVDEIANNNFDMLLCKILKRLFKNTNVWFINECDVLNCIFKIEKFNVAITHGDKLGKHSKEDVLKFKTRMMEITNNPIDYVIFGHIHDTMITSNYSRSGSLCGMDNYAFNGLNLSNGTASQNIYLVEKDGITGIEIKL